MQNAFGMGIVALGFLVGNLVVPDQKLSIGLGNSVGERSVRVVDLVRYQVHRIGFRRKNGIGRVFTIHDCSRVFYHTHITYSVIVLVETTLSKHTSK
jgi:hypothetical protein